MDDSWAGVRLDTRGFAADVASMRATLEGALGAGAERAGRAVETSLLRAVRTGKLGFEDLKKVALSALDAIAGAAVKNGLQAILGGRGGGDGGLLAVLGGVGGLPGRATGGPVVGGRGYLVGERGPELFVPTAGGRIDPGGAGAGREVRVSITVNAAAGEGGEALRQSSRRGGAGGAGGVDGMIVMPGLSRHPSRCRRWRVRQDGSRHKAATTKRRERNACHTG